MTTLTAWVGAEEGLRSQQFDGYVYGIAQARYVIRKVFRMVDDEAKQRGLDPLEHQALLQTFGAGHDLLTVSGLADRLDVPSALASRVVRVLDEKGLISRRHDAGDRRVTKLEVTPEGRELLRVIDQAVHIHVDYFQSQLTDDQRLAALAIFSFYVGFGSPDRLAAIIESSQATL
ncbi:MAG TPA: MarR family transcriptional regulator [Trebonia sp.]|nr:MarR family transcriptional regulator [Trebonia sp.]